MYDVNPLGPKMHLKELERQAIPTPRPVRFSNQSDSRVAALCTVMISLLRRLQAGIPRRMVWRDRGIYPGRRSVREASDIRKILSFVPEYPEISSQIRNLASHGDKGENSYVIEIARCGS